MSTRNHILNLLNREPHTVNELAAKIGITRNSVHLQIGQLEAAGLVERGDRRSAGRAGKPAFEYRTAAGAEDAYSGAYKPLLDSLLQVLATELPATRRRDLLEKTGELMAVSAGLSPAGEIASDLQQAVDVVNSLGAMAEVSNDGDKLCVTSYSCPIAQMVRSEATSCELVARFFSVATGVEVSSACKRDGLLVCQFEVPAVTQ